MSERAENEYGTAPGPPIGDCTTCGSALQLVGKNPSSLLCMNYQGCESADGRSGQERRVDQEPPVQMAGASYYPRYEGVHVGERQPGTDRRTAEPLYTRPTEQPVVDDVPEREPIVRIIEEYGEYMAEDRSSWSPARIGSLDIQTPETVAQRIHDAWSLSADAPGREHPPAPTEEAPEPEPVGYQRRDKFGKWGNEPEKWYPWDTTIYPDKDTAERRRSSAVLKYKVRPLFTHPPPGPAPEPVGLVSQITAFGLPVVLACDQKCEKAWGINSRPKRQLSDDPDDYVFMADSELGDAPTDPGTYEGGYPKPTDRRHNKWCFRECERSFSRQSFERPVKNRPDTHPPQPKPPEAASWKVILHEPDEDEGLADVAEVGEDGYLVVTDIPREAAYRIVEQWNERTHPPPTEPAVAGFVD